MTKRSLKNVFHFCKRSLISLTMPQRILLDVIKFGMNSELEKKANLTH